MSTATATAAVSCVTFGSGRLMSKFELPIWNVIGHRFVILVSARWCCPGGAAAAWRSPRTLPLLPSGKYSPHSSYDRPLLLKRAHDVSSLFDDVIVSIDGPREIHDSIRRVQGGLRCDRPRRRGSPCARADFANCLPHHGPESQSPAPSCYGDGDTRWPGLIPSPFLPPTLHRKRLIDLWCGPEKGKAKSR